ncbi:MAG TPA: 7-carboxy-7-deazaguanine synthase [Acidimicrobiales bacterium]|jgi:7-carboxy-7-deazaguanine synthase (Cx14CxxC type)|nr:7-carboxy-7-deazaguanine synthase [Acidimicrobiales bacterium]
MGYLVKEVFPTLQGEGARAGRAAVFCRFAGCNLWSGREEHRARAACTFCDTDFVGTDGPGGGRFADASALVSHVSEIAGPTRYIVCTGGEPLLQMDRPLIDALHERGFEIAIETNGTVAVPDGIDWVCMSPKANSDTIVVSGDELKLVFRQAGGEPERYEHLGFTHFFLQPMDGPERDAHTAAAIEYCLTHPQWRLSLQIHKYLGIP